MSSRFVILALDDSESSRKAIEFYKNKFQKDDDQINLFHCLAPSLLTNNTSEASQDKASHLMNSYKEEVSGAKLGKLIFVWDK